MYVVTSLCEFFSLLSFSFSFESVTSVRTSKIEELRVVSPCCHLRLKEEISKVFEYFA